MKPVSLSGREGFSIVEGIGYIVVFTIMMGAITYGMASLFRQQAHPLVTYNGEIFTQAPSFGDFQQAIDLHAAFSGAVDQADNILVLGGARSNPANPALSSTPLTASFAASTLAAASGSDPFQAYSSLDQWLVNSSQFTASEESNPDPADFTILTVQGQSAVTSITQQRRYTATINGQALSLYEVTYQAIDWSSGSPVFVSPALSYRFYYNSGEDTWSTPPGATHYWYRTDATWDRDQEGPTRVVFADPYGLAGQDSGAPLTPLSRFVYFLPQLR